MLSGSWDPHSRSDSGGWEGNVRGRSGDRKTQARRKDAPSLTSSSSKAWKFFLNLSLK